MKKTLFRIWIGVFLFLGVNKPLGAANPNFNQDNLRVELPEVILRSVKTPIRLEYSGKARLSSNDTFSCRLNGKSEIVIFEEGKAELFYSFGQERELSVSIGAFQKQLPVRSLPLWWSVIPPLLAIALALIFREVILALFLGIFSGAAILHIHVTQSILGVFKGLLSVIDTYLLEALADKEHVAIILFSLLIGAIVAVISRNGGMQGIVNRVARVARSPRSGQLATWGLGVGIFFDDYANTLIVGNTLRPVTDALRISREKLSYLVDSTAAPIAAIAFITTWIGAELGQIEKGMEAIAATPELAALPGDPGSYSIFLGSLQYSFYPIFTLAFMLMLILTNRDFGPMHKAEVRARKTGRVSTLKANKEKETDNFRPIKGAPARPINAILPILTVVIGTIIGLYSTGRIVLEGQLQDPGFLKSYEAMGIGQRLSTIIGGADAYKALLWSSLVGLLVATGLSIGQRILKLEEAVSAIFDGFKSMLPAMAILVLAWALASITKELHTADFLSQALQGALAPIWIPLVTFIMAALVSFATGSSWGTMTILYPIIIPLSWKLSLTAGLSPEAAMPLLYNAIACVLAGAVLGDHCSPISDTTILSSLASGCNHIDHVRTQLPYALTVGCVAAVVGTFPAALGIPFWISLPCGLFVLYAIIRWVGKPVPAYSV